MSDEAIRRRGPKAIGSAAKRITGMLAALLLAAATVLATGTAAAGDVAAQANPCGSSFTRIDTYYGSGGGHAGELRLYWSSAYEQNCAVMVKTQGTGHQDQIGVQIWPTGGKVDPTGGVENDWFYQYAGPVYTDKNIDMSGRCVSLHGFVGGAFELFFQVSAKGVHCG